MIRTAAGYAITLRHAALPPVQFACAAGETVLEAARRAGVLPAVACERGGCGACQARRLSGAVQYPLPVSARRLKGGDGSSFDLLCRAVPLAATELECLYPWRRVSLSPLSALLKTSTANP